MAPFEIFEDRKGNFRWRLRADNDVVISLSAKAHSTKGKCEDTIALARHITQAEFETLRNKAHSRNRLDRLDLQGSLD